MMNLLGRILGMGLLLLTFYVSYEILPDMWFDGPNVGDTYPHWWSVPVAILHLISWYLSGFLLMMPQLISKKFK